MCLAAAIAWQTVASLPDFKNLPHPGEPAAVPVAAEFAATPLTALTETGLFAALPGIAPPPSESDLTQRFRLAGTFFVLSQDLRPAVRKAVIADRARSTDYIVQEGDFLEEIMVVTVEQDHVVLLRGDRREILELSGRQVGALASDPDDVAAATQDAGGPDTGGGRFGNRIHDNRYLFHRDHLIEYYQEVMQSPQRLKQVFDSMKPLYDNNRNITGYVLDIEGEAEFFRNVGLREGDVVRHVNDMAMSNRRRAEYLIGEFALDRLNVFILDIERDGEPVKLIYEVR